MALKSSYTSEEKGAEIEESLDALDTLIDRVKVLFEQYFMGIQRQPPTHLHTTIERELRELQQQQIRNTALRYRLVTLQQKYGAYNSYWKRTLREIESGRYVRNLARVRAKAARTGEEIPEEILARMPKRMRDAIARDRELAMAKAERDGRMSDEVKAAVAVVAVEGNTEERKRMRRESAPALVVSAPPVLDDVHAAHGAHGHGAHAPGHAGAGAGAGAGERERGGSGVHPLPAAAKPSRSERHLLDDMFGDADIDAALAQLADEAATEIERRRPTREPPLGRPSDAPPLAAIARRAAATAVGSGPPRAPASTPPAITTPRVVPPIKIVPPGFPTSPGLTPVRAATPPAGVPIRAATPPAGVPVRPSMPAIPPLGGIHPVPPISGVQPAVNVGAAQAAATPQASQPSPSDSPSTSAASSQTDLASANASDLRDAAPSGPVAIPASGITITPQPSAPLAVPPTSTGSSGVRPAVSRPAVRPDPSPPAGIPGMSDSETRALYAKYVKARTLVGDRTEPMSYERMVKTLSSQAPKILRDHKSSGVEFNVVVRDNKVILKAKPK